MPGYLPGMRCLCVLLLIVWPSVTLAQPALTSQPSDSVVRLAIDPSRNQGRPVAALLDESSVRVEADGRWTQRARQVIQVLDAAAAPQVAERALSYSRDHQTLRLEWVRVLRPDGTVVSDRPAQDQEGDLSAALNNPIYSDQRVRRISLAGVAAGTIVDMAYTLEERAPRRAGDFFAQWALNGPVPIRRSRFTLDVPVTLEPRLVERNLIARREETVVGARRSTVWHAEDQQPVPNESFAADSNDLQQWVMLSGPASWNDLARWYDSLARPRYLLSPAVQRAADSVLKARGARTKLDTLRAWHRWVAQDVRYLSVALGIGSYQPRSADEVLSAGAGDCKDKATLFIALLRRAGFDARPVLLNQSGRLVAGVPSISQFNHAIAAVRDGASWTYTDLTAEYVRYGELPALYQGGRGLRVASSGESELVTFPATSAATSKSTLALTYRLDADGTATGSGHERAAGPAEPGIRQLLASALDDTKRATLSRQIAQTAIGTDGGTEARVDSLVTFDGRDLAVAPDVRYALRVANASHLVGSTRVLSIPAAMRGPARQFRTAVRELEAAGPRKLPIDAARIIPSMTTELEWRVTLPDGWTVELPAPVDTRSFFGRYESTWSLRGRELVLTRRLAGERGVVGPERMIEVLVWLRTVGADDQEFLTMKPTTGKAPEGVH